MIRYHVTTCLIGISLLPGCFLFSSNELDNKPVTRQIQKIKNTNIAPQNRYYLDKALLDLYKQIDDYPKYTKQIIEVAKINAQQGDTKKAIQLLKDANPLLELIESTDVHYLYHLTFGTITEDQYSLGTALNYASNDFEKAMVFTLLNQEEKGLMLADSYFPANKSSLNRTDYAFIQYRYAKAYKDSVVATKALENYKLDQDSLGIYKSLKLLSKITANTDKALSNLYNLRANNVKEGVIEIYGDLK